MPLAHNGMKVCSRKDCELARQPQPVANFHPQKDRDDGLRSQCIACHKRTNNPPGAHESAESKRERRQVAQQKKMSQALTVIKRAAATKRVTHIEEIAGSLMAKFGGVDQFSARLVNAIDSAESPGHQIRGLAVAGQFFTESSKLDAARQQDEDNLTDEEMFQVYQELRARCDPNVIEGEFTVNIEENDGDG